MWDGLMQQLLLPVLLHSQIQLLSQAMPPTGPNGPGQSSEPASSVSQVNRNTSPLLVFFIQPDIRRSSPVGDSSKGSGDSAISANRRQSEIFACLCRCFPNICLFVDSFLLKPFFPVGGLLGDVFLHLLPETYQHVRRR